MEPGEMVTLHKTGESAPLADTGDIHLILGLKLIGQNTVTGLQVVITGFQTELALKSYSVSTGLLEMPRLRLVDARRLDVLEKSDLDGVVSVEHRRFALHHNTRTSLQQGDWHHLSVGPEHLCHTDLLAKNSWAHNST